MSAGAQYSLGRVLGSGAFATVYLATRAGSADSFAVKVLADNLSHNDEVVGRFLAEINTLRRIQGPGILRVHDVGRTHTGQPFMALDFADLGNLEAYLAQRGRIGDKVAGTILGKTARALSRAHDFSIAHRDLKPANVLLRTQTGIVSADPIDHELLVADFGIARALAEATRQTTAVAGTPDYMAPEQYEQRADLRSDVFALGVLAYRLLTGHLPYPQLRLDLQYQAKKREDFVAIDRYRSDFAGAPAAIIHRSLSAEPGQRPNDAKSWLADFVAAFSGATSQVPPPPQSERPAGRASEPVGEGNVNYGLYARSLGLDRLRNLKRMADRGTLTAEELRHAKARLLVELGFTDAAELVTPMGPLGQMMAQQQLEQYGALLAEGVLSPAEFETVRHAILRQVGLV